MKKTIIIILALVCIGCSDDDKDEGIFRETFVFFENSSIVLETYDDSQFAFIRAGENLVFDYGKFSDPSENIADDESSSRLIFEISPTLDSFEFTNQELNDINCYFYGANSEFTSIAEVNQGSIIGNKIDDNSWEIEINVTVGTSEIKVDSLFILRK